MKRRFVLIVSLLLVLVISITGCKSGEDQEIDSSGSEAGEGPVIAGIYKFGDSTWFVNEGIAAGETAKSMGASEWMYLDAKDDGNLFLEMIDTVIAQDVDGVICCPPDQTLSQVAVEKLTNAGIPVIAADDPLIDENGKKIAPWVGIDAYEIGAESARWLVDYMVENGLDTQEDVGILVMTTDTVSSAVPRTDGQLAVLEEMLPDFPQEQIFKTDYKIDLDMAYTAANSVIVGNPQIEKWMVLATADEGAIGATRALEQAGLDKDSCTVGLGGYLAPGEFEKDSCHKATAYFSAREVGKYSAKHLIMMLNGEDPPKEYAVGAIMVTKDNYKEEMPEYL